MARWKKISSQGAPEAYMCSPKPEVTIEVQHVIMIDYDFARFSIHEKGHGDVNGWPCETVKDAKREALSLWNRMDTSNDRTDG